MTDKEKIRKEIEKLYVYWDGVIQSSATTGAVARKNMCKELLSFIDSLQDEPVSEDFEKELDEWMKYGPHTNYPWCTIPNAIKITAEHFFELGMVASNKAQKGE